ncbi:MAG: ribonuclease III [candidate division Zixibacteria bacterium]|nr:ribonuclease III [candidate division Zixibacteria bacterium]
MSLWHSIKELLGARELPPEDPKLEGIQRLLGYNFRDIALLQLGLTHRSFARSNNHDQQSNERLEFLGDSVLGVIISDQLFKDLPLESEGNLTKTKAMLVNETTLSTLGREIGLNKYVRLSPEEDRAGGRERASIISDAFEAVIGAVYLDGGIEAARDVVLRLIYIRKDRIVADTSQRNYKGDLLELIQAKGEGVPRYDVISEVGPDHEKTFHVVVSIGGLKVGEGVGSSKKEAEQKAAAQALESLEK